MNRFTRINELSPTISEQPRIVSPQKVDLDYDKYNGNRNKQSTDNLHSITNKIKSPKFENLDNSSQLKNSMGMGHNASGNYGEYTGRAGTANKNPNFGARPGTSGDAFGARGGMSKSVGSKSKTRFPAVKTGILNPLSAEPEDLNDKLKEDREAVEDLERWDSEYKLVAISKALENDQKKNKEGQNGSLKDKYGKTPSLNREILNLIDEEDWAFAGVGRDLKHPKVSTMNKSKVRVPQKSLETIMNEFNKKILNDILFNRVSKKVVPHKEGDKTNKLDLDYATKNVQTDTVNNFKNLQQAIQTNPRIIEYDTLYQKLTAVKNAPEGVFDFTEDKKKIQEAENDYTTIEAGLKIQFESIITEIAKKKDSLNDYRMQVHNNNEEVKLLEEEIDEITRRYEGIEIQFNQQKETNKNIRSNQGRGTKRTGFKDANRQAAFIEEYSKIQRQMEEKKEQVNEIRETIDNIVQETHKCQQKLSNLEREIKDLKFKKHQIRLQLKQLYVKILKSEEHIFRQEASFITVIKNMWKINEEVIEDMFPRFIDKETLAYLIENARLEYELDQLEALAKNQGLKLKDLHQNDMSHNHDIYNRFIKTQGSLRKPLSEQLVDVKERLQNLKKGIVKMKRPVFVKDGNSRSRIIRWEELNFDTDEVDEPHVDEQYIQEKISRAVQTIRAKLEELKEKEIQRIFAIHINKEIEEKNLRSLNKTLISLFGRQNAERIYLRFVRLKQSHDFKIQQNKTFMFSSTKQNSSIVPDKSKNSYTMMLSYATSFRPNKGNENAQVAEQNQEECQRKEDFTREIEEFKEMHNNENSGRPRFIHGDDLWNEELKVSNYYSSKPATPNDFMGKSNLKVSNNNSRVIKTAAGSSRGVTFKEPSKTVTNKEGQFQKIF